MKKNLIILVLSFAVGFLTHALIFPDFLSNGIADVQQLVLPNPSIAPKQTSEQTNTFLTNVIYKDGYFSRHNISLPVGSYLTITNTSTQHPMWLLSTNPLLAIPRGYGESEQIKVRMDVRGRFLVADKNNPQEKLLITVK